MIQVPWQKESRSGFGHCSAIFAVLCQLGSEQRAPNGRPAIDPGDTKLYSFPICLKVHTFFLESACEGFFVKKTSAELHLLYIFTSSPLHNHILTYISAHVHICASTSLLILTSSHLHLRSSSSWHIYISAHLHILASTCPLIFIFTHLHLCSSSHPHIYSSHLHLSLFLTFSLKAGGSAAGAPRNATLCGDRACRAHEMQARVRFAPVRRNPLRRSCVSSARNAGESAICPGPAQPSAENRACRVREMQARVDIDNCRPPRSGYRQLSGP